ncbi:MAG: hypothetical protein JJ975_14795 [Bacteroidia bacterium]|nr:hypothetical protein [Bacteroidia bacterium]
MNVRSFITASLLLSVLSGFAFRSLPTSNGDVPETERIVRHNRGACINDIKKLELSIAYINEADSLVVTSSKIYPVSSFRFLINYQDGESVFTRVEGNQITGTARELLLRGQAGDHIMIDEVRIQTEEGIRTLVPAMYSLTGE